MYAKRKMMSTMILTVLLLVHATTPTLAQDAEGEPLLHITQVDTSNFPTVTVYVSVTDAQGEPVGIEPGRLVLQEDGVTIQPDQLQGNTEVVDALTTMLVMDISGSMYTADKLTNAKSAARAYIEQMRSGDVAGLMSFNTAVTYVQSLTADKVRLETAIDSLIADQDTAMYDALVEAAGVLDSVPGRKAIIVLTDGMDNASQAGAADVIARIGPSGLSISTIGLGNPEDKDATLAGIDEPALISLASQAGGEYAFANDAQGLTRLYQRYARVLQSEYAITYTSPGTLRDGLTRHLTVAMADAGAAVQGAAYNPGGLVPEVGEPASWGFFLAAFLLLIALIILPALIGRLVSMSLPRKLPITRKRKPRIRFKDT